MAQGDYTMTFPRRPNPEAGSDEDGVSTGLKADEGGATSAPSSAYSGDERRPLHLSPDKMPEVPKEAWAYLKALDDYTNNLTGVPPKKDKE